MIEPKIFDISSMPNFNSTVKNGIQSVTNKIVFWGKLPWMSEYAVDTLCCTNHGACLCVAHTEKGKIWRCEVCNEGCYIE